MGNLWKESLPGHVVFSIPRQTDETEMRSCMWSIGSHCAHEECVRRAEIMLRAVPRFAIWCSPCNGSLIWRGSGKQGTVTSRGCDGGCVKEEGNRDNVLCNFPSFLSVSGSLNRLAAGTVE